MVKLNKYQKEVEKQLLKNEKQVLEELKQNYVEALKDVKLRIQNLMSDEMTQSKIYQKQYQENLERQLQANIDLLSTKNFNSISDYLKATYQDGFVGTLYNMQKEGVPFVMPLNQDTIIKSILKKTEDFQLSKTLYKNAEKLKKTIKGEITRGISGGSTYSDIAKKITLNSEADLKKSYRIARTEGGRVQSESKFEVMQRAKSNGADVVKQWDSTMDSRTRMTHARLDGQIREMEEEFEIDGKQAMYPHGFGIAEEDINCRCCLLERARWAIEDETNFTKSIDGDIVEFKNVKDYQEFKQKYFNFYENYDTMAKIDKEGIKNVQYVGKLDKNRLGKYKDAIVTDEVILTDERMYHIKEHHPGDYEKYGKYINTIIEDPDYILDDNKNLDTILLMKTIQDEQKNIQIVVRLNTNGSLKEKQNSILTLWKVKTKTYNQMLRNKKIIWEKLDKNE